MKKTTKILVKFYTDVTGMALGAISELAKDGGHLERIEDKTYLVEVQK